MAVGLLGMKVGMTQIYDSEGNVVPVTVVRVGPCTVLQVRTLEKDGYRAMQLGFGDRPRRLASRAERGHVAKIGGKREKVRAAAGMAPVPKADCEPPVYVREFRFEDGDPEVAVGQTLTTELFKDVARVDVVGQNKGRGFAGVMKQHNFHGLPASHGVKRHHRAPGSVGSNSTDRGHSGKIKKGVRMSGRWGNERCTVRNLKVAGLDAENNLVLVQGSVPGPIGGYVMVRKTNKRG